MLNVIFFKTEAGNQPVLEWLRSLGDDDRKIIGDDLRTVQFGWPIGMPLCKPLGDGLYEVRSKISDKKIVRLIFFQSEDNLIIVDGFIKKTQRTPKSELDYSKKCKSEYERNLLELRKNFKRK